MAEKKKKKYSFRISLLADNRPYKFMQFGVPVLPYRTEKRLQTAGNNDDKKI